MPMGSMKSCNSTSPGCTAGRRSPVATSEKSRWASWSRSMLIFVPSVVILDRHVEGLAVFPAEDDPPLVVDPYRVEAGQVAPQGFQPVAGRNPQGIQHAGRVDLLQLAAGNGLNLARQPAHLAPGEDRDDFLVPERSDHASCYRLALVAAIGIKFPPRPGRGRQGVRFAPFSQCHRKR